MPKIKFPRQVALHPVEEILMPIGLNLASNCEKCEIAGSLRRNKPHVSDIEIIFVPKMRVHVPPQLDMFPSPPVLVSEMDERIDELVRQGVFAPRLSAIGSTMCGPLVKLLVHIPSGIPVDFFATSHAGWWTTLVSRTGGKESNLELARRALRLGFNWNPGDVGFTRMADGVKFPIFSEEDAFRFVGMPCLPPEARA